MGLITFLKIVGYTFGLLSCGLLFIGAYVSTQLIIHRFDLGVHGVPHAIAIISLFGAIVAFFVSRYSFNKMNEFDSEAPHA